MILHEVRRLGFSSYVTAVKTLFEALVSTLVQFLSMTTH
jgi:hypothetical protein